jgi:hypothetical protein
MRITSAGLVGIGTSSPIRDLVIKNSSGDASFRMETASYTNDVLTLRNSNGRLDFGALAMTILTNGNVGIGTSSPIGDLSIVDSTTSSGVEIQPEITTDTNRITNYDRGDSS